MLKTFEDLVLSKLDNLLRVLAVSVTKGMKRSEQIILLDRAGLPPKDIADLLGTTGNTVSVALSNLRKVREKKGKGVSSRKK